MSRYVFRAAWFILFMTNCTTGNQIQSKEEVEYQKYASAMKKRSDKPNPPEKWLQIYKESGLQEFIYGSGDNTETGNKTVKDLDEFYEKIIVEKYARHEYQESLRVKFIGHAIHVLSLAQRENNEATKLLIKYTRELCKNNKALDVALSYKCIAHVKGLIDKDEYNAMIKRIRFQIRFLIELSEQSIADATKVAPKDFVDRFRSEIEGYKQYLADFEALIIQ